MIGSTLTERFTVYHTNASGGNPDSYRVASPEVIGKVQSLGAMEALSANAEGRFQARVGYRGRFEYDAALVVNALVRRHDDDKCWLVQQVQTSNRRDGAGRPDHLIVELAAVDAPPPLPDALTQARRNRP